MARQVYKLREDEYISRPEDADLMSRDNPTYASFGDGDGTTASANATGNLIQLSRYLGLGRSGFFSVDVGEVSEPYWVQLRAEELMEKCKGGESLGCYFEDESPKVSDRYLTRSTLSWLSMTVPAFTSA